MEVLAHPAFAVWRGSNRHHRGQSPYLQVQAQAHDILQDLTFTPPTRAQIKEYIYSSIATSSHHDSQTIKSTTTPLCLTTMILCKTLAKKSEFTTDSSSFPLNRTRYDFEYEDDDDEQNGDVDIENKYYNAKQLKSDDAEAAIDEFLGIPALEEEKSDWYEYPLYT